MGGQLVKHLDQNGCCDGHAVGKHTLSSIEDTVERAKKLCAQITEAEDVALPEAVGRVSSGDTISLFSLPIHDHSAVDGYALGGSGTGSFDIVGRLIAGDSRKENLSSNEAMRIMTGAPTPDGTKCVVMQEHAILKDGTVQANFDIPEGDNIRRAG